MSDANIPTMVTVTFDDPLPRGDTAIGFVQIRKPGAGELRGLSMVDLIKLEVDALRQLLPRITIPPITIQEVDTLSPADMFQCANEVANFLLPRAILTDSRPQ